MRHGFGKTKHAREGAVTTGWRALSCGCVMLMAAGCASDPQAQYSHGVAHTAPAAVAGGVDHTSVADDPMAEIAPTDSSPDDRARLRRTPPPRAHGKTYNTAVIDDAGQVRNVEIRMRDGDTAETRIDGKLVPWEQVLVHRRGYVEIVDEQGNAQLKFNLPRGMTSFPQPRR